MPTIYRRGRGKRAYYYGVESARVDGKPRLVSQIYLGKAEDIIDRKLSPPKPTSVAVVEFGIIAALLDVTGELGFVQLVDECVAKREQGASVGQYMLIAAMNRCSSPTSKAGMAEWYEGTILKRILGISRKLLTSQRFWDNMNLMTAEDLANLKLALAKRVVTVHNPSLDMLLYDSTSFFTFIDTQTSCRLPQRGHNKQKRNDLRQVGLALLMARESSMPLAYDLYQGNKNDVTEFDPFITSFVEKYKEIFKGCEEITLIFDKGNNSKRNMGKLDASPFHFVGSLRIDHHKDLLEIPVDDCYRACEGADLADLSYYRTTKEIFEQTRTVISVYNPALKEGQLAGITMNLKKTCEALSRLQAALEERRTAQRKGRAPTVESVTKAARRLLRRQFMHGIVKTHVVERDGWINLEYHVDEEALEELKAKHLGKTLLFTDRDDWGAEEIILAYREQWSIEDAFHMMKDASWVSWAPLYHWTDQKIEVHAFYCFSALLFSCILSKKIREAKLGITPHRALEQLRRIQEVTMYYPKERGADHAPTVTMIAEMTGEQERLYNALGLAQHQVLYNTPETE